MSNCHSPRLVYQALCTIPVCQNLFPTVTQSHSTACNVKSHTTACNVTSHTTACNVTSHTTACNVTSHITACNVTSHVTHHSVYKLETTHKMQTSTRYHLEFCGKSYFRTKLLTSGAKYLLNSHVWRRYLNAWSSYYKRKIF